MFTISNALRAPLQRVGASLTYLCARLNERSTWVAVGVGITGAAALSAPCSYAFIAVAVVGAILPTGGQTDA